MECCEFKWLNRTGFDVDTSLMLYRIYEFAVAPLVPYNSTYITYIIYITYTTYRYYYTLLVTLLLGVYC